jgi:MSHA biogenesis protein MshN
MAAPSPLLSPSHKLAQSKPQPGAHQGRVQSSSRMQVKPVKLTLTQRSEKKYQEASKLSQQGLIQQAIEKYRQILQLNPAHSLSRQALVALYFGREQTHLALAVLDRGLAIEPDNINWSLLAGKIHYKQKNYGVALQYLKLPLKASEQLEYVALKAASLQQLKQFDKASNEFAQLATANPTNGRWWLGLATSFEAQGETTQAIAAYRKSLALSNISQTSRQFVLSRLSLLDAKE